MRILWAGLGFLALALGVLGLFLPLLPTVPFLILAAALFARSSQRLHDWLLSHPTFGPPIRDWRDRGAISLGAKRKATAAMAITVLLTALLGFGWGVLALQATALATVLVFIWTRPPA